MEGYGFSGWFVMLLGMGTVFFGLISLILITMLMSLFCRLKGEKSQEAPKSAFEEAPAVAAAPAIIADRPRFIAAVSAAIAEHMGTDPSGLRINSIRRTDGADTTRGALIAAVSAAIATDMGSDVNGIRIHSLKRV